MTATATTQFSRAWAMPSADTLSIPPINEFAMRYLEHAAVSIDPFARNSKMATITNDLNPATTADYHMDAEAFLVEMASKGVRADVAIFDPPYSPRQVSECYQSIGVKAGMKETQTAAMYLRVRLALCNVLTDDAVVLSFGWNSVGMGKKHGFALLEVLLCCHGGAHNDTICLAEKREASLFAKEQQ